MPLIIVSAFRRRAHDEGRYQLMQMAKTSAALARLDEARVPFISVLTDPTTGGVTASFAMLGDLNIAEPEALIGFAGPRVIEQTIRQKLPKGFQHAEFLLPARHAGRHRRPARDAELPHQLAALFYFLKPWITRARYSSYVDAETKSRGSTSASTAYRQ